MVKLPAISARTSAMTRLHLGALRAFAAIAAVLAAMAAASAQSSPSSPGLLDGLFGGGDPAPSGRERAQAPAGDLVVRIDRLEAQVRQLTGVIEELQFRNQQLAEQLRHMQEDAEARSPDAAARGAPQPPAQARTPANPTVARPPVVAATPPRRGDAFDPTQNPTAPGAPRVLGSLPANGGAGQPAEVVEETSTATPPGRVPGEPLRLSTLGGVAPDGGPAAPGAGGAVPGDGPPRPPAAPGTQVATLPPSDSPKDNFDLAYGYLQHKDYALAEESFHAFLRKFPSDRLAPDAEYWLGESMYQRQRYRDAAEAFLNVSTKYESTAKGPDALLRLGQSLAALGEKEAACASLGEVLRKYPRAALSVKQGVEREQKRAGC
jgi:tol-pal system protein YbgF